MIVPVAGDDWDRLLARAEEVAGAHGTGIVVFPPAPSAARLAAAYRTAVPSLSRVAAARREPVLIPLRRLELLRVLAGDAGLGDRIDFVRRVLGPVLALPDAEAMLEILDAWHEERPGRRRRPPGPPPREHRAQALGPYRGAHRLGRAGAGRPLRAGDRRAPPPGPGARVAAPRPPRPRALTGIRRSPHSESTRRRPVSTKRRRSRPTGPTHSVRRSLSSVTGWETLATESSGRPVSAFGSSTLPGASASR